MRSFARLSSNRPLVGSVVALVALALIGTTVAWTALDDQVTLSLDGRTSQVHTRGGTVAELLKSRGVTLRSHDLVVPARDTRIHDGSRVSVRFGKPLALDVDGRRSTVWTTASTVDGALGELGMRQPGASYSHSRGTAIDREGMALQIATPKRVVLRVGARRAATRTASVITVRELLTSLHVPFGADDSVSPPLYHLVHDGDRVVVTRLRTVRKQVSGEPVPFGTVERPDPSLEKGSTTTVRPGRSGLRDVTYAVIIRNGQITKRSVVRQTLLRAPVARLVRVGTKAPAGNFAGGSSAWDRIAQCESGGNWSANTGNGYYGGLQFSLGTWHGYGGSGRPDQHSRGDQIAIAEKVRAAEGGYGAWPVCGKQA